MKYYETHESAYRKRLAEGYVMWDKGAYESVYTRGFVERFLEKTAWTPACTKVLLLGCGTGPLACILAAQGFQVSGVDISESAIEFARKQAAERGLKVEFLVGDACQSLFPESTFDLVIDDHLMHCIVLPADRENVLRGVWKMLRAGGEFWVETMIGHPAMVAPDSWGMDEAGVCWSHIPESMRTKECVVRDGKLYLPTRVIRTAPGLVLEELRAAGFAVLWDEVQAPQAKTEAGVLHARCRKP
ncbi:MAG: class I SAM-dependent methyltransferase [Planctomycetota bacterium]|nr:class I SAM-dependent methyltransferase [Planctomycetota bacterium]